MGRAPCCAKVGLHRGPWTPREDTLLTKYIQAHGEGHWRSLPKKAGLLRCGKSCRLRWMNYLRPDIKRGNITPDEDDLIIRLHSLLGNRWSLIAGRLPGRTDNEIKNYWNTHLSKRLRSQGTDPKTHKKLSDPQLVNRGVTNNKKRKNNSTNSTNQNKSRKVNINSIDAVNKIIMMTKNNIVGPERQKVHLPKPIRVTRNYSFEGNQTTTSGSSSQEKAGSSEGTYGDDQEQVDNSSSWLSFKVGDDGDVGFLINDDHDDHHNRHDQLHVNGLSVSDHDQYLECESNIIGAEGQVHNATLQRLYEEYLQLLRTEDQQQQHHHDQVELDTFAESLLN